MPECTVSLHLAPGVVRQPPATMLFLRDAQDAVAGAVMQLNMGEGKTRVILPMLALHLAKRGGDRAVSRPA